MKGTEHSLSLRVPCYHGKADLKQGTLTEGEGSMVHLIKVACFVTNTNNNLGIETS
jgi:hypothetical protein